MKILVPAIACTALVACAAPEPLASRGPGDRIHPAFVDGFPDRHCRSDKSGSGHDLCKDVKYLVRARVIPADGDLPEFCISYMPYNKLTVHMGPPNPLNPPQAGKAKITWTLDPGSNFGFVGKGIAPVKGYEGAADDLFEPVPIVVPGPSPSPLRKSVSLDIRPNVPAGKEVHHIPVVQFRAGSKVLQCVGVDPIIINNAD